MQEIADGIFYCGRFDGDRRLFDQLMPIPQGTSYNSYLVKGGNKTALIDTMYEKFEGEFLDEIIASGHKIDYIISNHAEPDHSAAIPALLEKFPDAKVFCTKKCGENLVNMLGVDASKICDVADGEILDLGGRKLKFIHAPWVHWPDTMFTHLQEDNLLFTCDFFGAHHTHCGIFSDDSAELADSAKGYYAEIMMPFRNFCFRHLEKVKALNPKMILPGHGPIYRNPEFIYSLYEKWTSPNPSRKVLIAYVSMYGNTEKMAKSLAENLNTRGVEAILIDIISGDESSFAKHLIDSAGLVIGTSMVLAGPHPKALYLSHISGILRPNLKFYSLIGSFGWGGNLTSAIDANLATMKLKRLEPVIAKGKSLEDDAVKLAMLADDIIAEFDALAKV